MKRTIKNIIAIAIVIVMGAAVFFTMNMAKSNLNKANSNSTQMSNNTPPGMASGDNNSSNSNTPPEKPSGDSNNNDGNTPPEMPSGDSNSSDSNTPANMSQMNNPNESASLSVGYYIAFIIEGLILAMALMYLIMSLLNKKTFKGTFSSKDKIIIYALAVIVITTATTLVSAYTTEKVFLNNTSQQNNNQNGPGGMPGQSNENVSYASANEVSQDKTITDKEYKSSTADENALTATDGANVTATELKVTKTGDSDGGDNTSFYGTNSAIIAKDKAQLTLKNINVTTNATGANGVFCFGGSATTNNASSDGTTVNISDSTIKTTKDNSGGIMTTGGGIMNASNLNISTAGTSSAAIRTDRGGGTVNVDGGTYKTTGKGSPTVYSTADVTVKNATLNATSSEGIVIEGKNKVSLSNCKLTDSNTQLNGQSTTYKNIFIYQSVSGDASEGTGEFTAKNSTITTNKGDSFYVTNTSATINLTNNTIVNNDKDGNFLRAKSDSWGNSGSNGGDVTLTMNNQSADGNIVIDSVSTLDMTMKSSTYKGAINVDNSAKSIKLTLDKNSKITLTADSYVTSLEDEDSTYSNINFNGHKLYVNGTAIN